MNLDLHGRGLRRGNNSYLQLRSSLESHNLINVQEVLDRVRDELEKYPNVVGTGISMKFKNGEVLDQPCIVVRVTKKIPNLKDGAVPAKIDGWPTDVIETGIPELTAAFPEPGCPLRPGNSIAHARHTGSGTLGCLVKDVSPLGTIRSYLDKSPFSDILFLNCRSRNSDEE